MCRAITASSSDVLTAKARAGVRVRVIYDAVGSLGVSAPFLAGLRAAGVQCVQYSPINPLKGPTALNERDHRKILIADDKVAIVGGVNLATTYESAPPIAHALGGDKQPAKSASPVWHDVDLEIRGPVVPQLARLFRQHWQEQKGPPLPPEPAYKGPAQGKEVVRVIGSSPTRARDALLRLRPHGHPLRPEQHLDDRRLFRADTARSCARCGQRPAVVSTCASCCPRIADVGATLAVQRSYYPRLLAAGIKVYERSDGIVHSKSMVVDGVWSLVGSSNFDQRSILFNDEVDVVVLGKATADQLRKTILTDIGHGKLIDWQTVRQQGALQRMKGWFWRLWQRLL